jgi:hypothetical protein
MILFRNCSSSGALVGGILEAVCHSGEDSSSLRSSASSVSAATRAKSCGSAGPLEVVREAGVLTPAVYFGALALGGSRREAWVMAPA